jgi:hypothetical protein
MGGDGGADANQKFTLSEAEWVKVQKVKLESKNFQISHGTCGHGLLYNRKECSTNRPFFMQNKANLCKAKNKVSSFVTSE